MIVFRDTASLVGHETLENEWYVLIKVYRVLRDTLYCHILYVCCIPTHRVYQLDDTTPFHYTCSEAALALIYAKYYTFAVFGIRVFIGGKYFRFLTPDQYGPCRSICRNIFITY